jgi:hypothetical protein
MDKFYVVLFGSLAAAVAIYVLPALIFLGSSFESSSRIWWAKAFAIGFSSILCAVPLLLLAFNRRWIRQIPEKVVVKRLTIASWIMIPTLLVLFFTGATPLRFLGELHVLLADTHHTTGTVISSQSYHSSSSKSWRRYWEITYTFTHKGSEFTGGYRALDDRAKGSDIAVAFVETRPSSNVVSDDTVVWRSFMERLMLSSGIPFLGVWFLVFVMISWSQEPLVTAKSSSGPSA